MHTCDYEAKITEGDSSCGLSARNSKLNSQLHYINQPFGMLRVEAFIPTRPKLRVTKTNLKMDDAGAPPARRNVAKLFISNNGAKDVVVIILVHENRGRVGWKLQLYMV